jgi:hypothetical protein
MTDLITRDPNDTGEIPLGIGEERTVILRIDAGEATQRIDPRLIKAPSFDAIARKVIDIDDTVTFHSPMNVATGTETQSPPPAAAETQVHTILYSLAGVSAGIDGEFEGPQKPPPPLPKPPTSHAARRASFSVRGMVSRGRHRAPAPAWTRWAIGVGALLIGGSLGMFILWAVSR